MILNISFILFLIVASVNYYLNKKGYIQSGVNRKGSFIIIAIAILSAFIIYYFGSKNNLSITADFFRIYLPAVGIVIGIIWSIQIAFSYSKNR